MTGLESYKLTIKQIGDFVWFSSKPKQSKYSSVLEALKSHYKYISSKAKALIGDFNKFMEKAKAELNRLSNARIGLKFYIATPRDWDSQTAIEKVKKFILAKFNIPEENLILAFHSHPENPHIHVLIFPQTVDGKKLRIQPKDLKDFHDSWGELLIKEGYIPFKLESGSLGKVPIWLVKRYPELYEEYKKVLAEYKQIFLELMQEKERETAEKVEERKEPVKETEEDREMRIYKTQLEEVEKQLKGLGFEDEAKICIVAIKENEPVIQRIIYTRKLREIEFIKFLRQLNAKGYNIYISLNELKEDAKDRRKESFKEEQKHIYLDIDGDKLGRDGLEILREILQKEKLPKPSLVLRTSEKNYQVIWTLKDPISWDKVEAINKALAKKYGLDPATDISRVFRLAGFFNRKAGKGSFVYVSQYLSSFQEVDKEVFLKYLDEVREVREVKQTKITPKEEAKEVPKYLASSEKEKEIDETIKKLVKAGLIGFDVVATWLDEMKIMEELKKKGDKLYETAIYHKYVYMSLLLGVAKHIKEKEGDKFKQFIRSNADNIRYVLGRLTLSKGDWDKYKSWSMSEAEASAVYLALKSVVAYKGYLDKKLVEVVKTNFEEILAEERPDKLARNPKYVDITIANIERQIEEELREDLDNERRPFR